MLSSGFIRLNSAAEKLLVVNDQTIFNLLVHNNLESHNCLVSASERDMNKSDQENTDIKQKKRGKRSPKSITKRKQRYREKQLGLFKIKERQLQNQLNETITELCETKMELSRHVAERKRSPVLCRVIFSYYYLFSSLNYFLEFT